MHKLTLLAIAATVSLTTAGRVSADVRLTLHDGLVSIVAKDATVRQILEEWARVGQTRIVNVERIAGGPMTIEISDVPEKQALDILLRSVSGYVAAPRATIIGDASRFDRIMVNPAAAQPRSNTPSSAAPPPLPQSRFQLQPFQPESDDPLLNPNLPGDPGQRPPVVNVFTPPMPPLPDGGRGATAPAFPAPTAPVGTATPGMVLPPPQPQGQQPQGQPPLQPQRQPQGQPGRF
jgi:hypothetical protein